MCFRLAAATVDGRIPRCICVVGRLSVLRSQSWQLVMHYEAITDGPPLTPPPSLGLLTTVWWRHSSLQSQRPRTPAGSTRRNPLDPSRTKPRKSYTTDFAPLGAQLTNEYLLVFVFEQNLVGISAVMLVAFY